MPEFRPYVPTDRDACLAIFDSNCPTFLLPGERANFEVWLDAPEGTYLVLVEDSEVIASCGFIVCREQGLLTLTWGLLHADQHGRRLGELMLLERLVLGVASGEAQYSQLATTPKVEPFFARVGYRRIECTPDGWGPGMDRVDMRLDLGAEVVDDLRRRRAELCPRIDE